MKWIATLLFIGICNVMYAQNLTTKYEATKGKETPEYGEIIDWWQRIDKASAKVTMQRKGMSDAGFPLHLVTVSNQPVASFKAAHAANKIVILVNNGIHPGEPDGIDASMLLVKDIVNGKMKLPDNVVLGIIPVYNIGGCLNRSENYRVDQDGPAAFGSRGNSQNLDLNRDFIKNDSKESLAFTAIFHEMDPDIFIDNHVSNGADYQHVMTLLTTHHQKLTGTMGKYLRETFEPSLYRGMKNSGYDMVPYVNHFGSTVDKGWPAFWDSPRYASGYAALFHTFSFVPETHMLKPYEQRVAATLALMKCFIQFANGNAAAIRQERAIAKKADKEQQEYYTAYRLDTTQKSWIEFKGYEAVYKKSNVSGLPRLFYDRTKPYTQQIPHFGYYQPVAKVTKPKAYIIPQGWTKVIDRLKANKIAMHAFKADTILDVSTYYIQSYKSSAVPYESHHANTNVITTTQKEKRTFRKGDWMIWMDQPANHFLIETLEPACVDSYFSWNFFDGILGRKEWFSDYAFEDIAAAYLKEKPELQNQLNEKRKTDTAFANSAAAQLQFVYEHSPYREPDYMRYPVYRVE